jgi:hypothetical protein
MLEGDFSSSMTTYIALFVLPIVFAYLLVAYVDRLDKEDYRQKFEKLYVDITLNNSDRGKYTVLFMPLFFLRRWITILIPVLLINSSGL